MHNGRSSISGGVLLLCALVLTFPVLGSTANELNTLGVERFQAGDYAGAVDALRKAANANPDNATLRRNLAQALNGWGVELGERSDYDAAVRRLREALRLDPRHAVIRANLATTRVNYGARLMDEKRFDRAERVLTDAYETATSGQLAMVDDRRATLYLLWARDQRKEGNVEGAVTRLRKALQVAPSYVPALLDMAEIAYRRGDNIDALEYYLDAQEANPAVEGLEEMIQKIFREQEIESGFEKRTDRYFTVSYEGEIDRDSAREALTILAQAYRQIGRELDAYPREKLPVVLYRHDQYASATIAPDWSGALFDGKMRVPLPKGRLDRRQQERLQQTLFHEYTHALVRETAPEAQLPAWFNEGLACMFEVDRDERRRRDAEDRKVLAMLRRQKQLIGIRALPEAFTSIRDQSEAEKAYRISRCFVGWLADRYRTDRLREVLERTGQGETVPGAIERVYGQSLAELEEAWLKDVGD
jgi:tetratricopeptide (TPR) repeat protein